nr:uncharacterized protein LOC125639466 [Caretta caretta]
MPGTVVPAAGSLALSQSCCWRGDPFATEPKEAAALSLSPRISLPPTELPGSPPAPYHQPVRGWPLDGHQQHMRRPGRLGRPVGSAHPVLDLCRVRAPGLADHSRALPAWRISYGFKYIALAQPLFHYTQSLGKAGARGEFILEDILLLRVTWEAREGLLLQCGFHPGPYAACLCAAMVPPPLKAQWRRHVSLTGTRTTVALPRNLRKCIAQVLDETFEEITEADYRDVREHINALFCI